MYDRYASAFSVNALKLSADRPYTATKTDAGLHADLLVGQNAAVLHSTGFSVGPNADLTQLYITLNIPTANGNGVQLRVGKMVTLMGLEVIEDVANPNWSEGNQFVYVENFTATGAELDYRLSPLLNVALRIDNGWDRVVDTAGHRDFMGLVGFTPGPKTSFILVPYYGAEEEGTNAARYGIDALFNQKFGKTSVWLQGDYGREQASAALPDSTRAADWWAVGGWLATDVSPKVGGALRADYLHDAHAARTFAAFGLPIAAAHTLWSVTGTLNLKTWANALLRPEVRYDHSNFPVFNGKNEQATVAVSVAFLY